MKPCPLTSLLFLSSIFLSSFHHAVAHAQPSITSFAFPCGGETSSSGRFTLHSTIGEPTIGSARSVRFTLRGGFDNAPSSAPRCPADLDDGSGTGMSDGGVTIDDLLFFLDVFGRGVSRADLDNGSGTGMPDGGVTIDDLLYFLQRFEAGC